MEEDVIELTKLFTLGNVKRDILSCVVCEYLSHMQWLDIPSHALTALAVKNVRDDKREAMELVHNARRNTIQLFSLDITEHLYLLSVRPYTNRSVKINMTVHLMMEVKLSNVNRGQIDFIRHQAIWALFGHMPSVDLPGSYSALSLRRDRGVVRDTIYTIILMDTLYDKFTESEIEPDNSLLFQGFIVERCKPYNLRKPERQFKAGNDLYNFDVTYGSELQEFVSNIEETTSITDDIINHIIRGSIISDMKFRGSGVHNQTAKKELRYSVSFAEVREKDVPPFGIIKHVLNITVSNNPNGKSSSSLKCSNTRVNTSIYSIERDEKNKVDSLDFVYDKFKGVYVYNTMPFICSTERRLFLLGDTRVISVNDIDVNSGEHEIPVGETAARMLARIELFDKIKLFEGTLKYRKFETTTKPLFTVEEYYKYFTTFPLAASTLPLLLMKGIEYLINMIIYLDEGDELLSDNQIKESANIFYSHLVDLGDEKYKKFPDLGIPDGKSRFNAYYKNASVKEIFDAMVRRDEKGYINLMRKSFNNPVVVEIIKSHIDIETTLQRGKKQPIKSEIKPSSSEIQETESEDEEEQDTESEITKSSSEIPEKSKHGFILKSKLRLKPKAIKLVSWTYSELNAIKTKNGFLQKPRENGDMNDLINKVAHLPRKASHVRVNVLVPKAMYAGYYSMPIRRFMMRWILNDLEEEHVPIDGTRYIEISTVNEPQLGGGHKSGITGVNFASVIPFDEAIDLDIKTVLSNYINRKEFYIIFDSYKREWLSGKEIERGYMPEYGLKSDNTRRILLSRAYGHEGYIIFYVPISLKTMKDLKQWLKTKGIIEGHDFDLVKFKRQTFEGEVPEIEPYPDELELSNIDTSREIYVDY